MGLEKPGLAWEKPTYTREQFDEFTLQLATDIQDLELRGWQIDTIHVNDGARELLASQNKGSITSIDFGDLGYSFGLYQSRYRVEFQSVRWKNYGSKFAYCFDVSTSDTTEIRKFSFA